jgi:hypothetical protein
MFKFLSGFNGVKRIRTTTTTTNRIKQFKWFTIIYTMKNKEQEILNYISVS